jgi:hypothetical protein
MRAGDARRSGNQGHRQRRGWGLLAAYPRRPTRVLLVIGLAALLAQRVVLISAKPAPAELLAGFPAPYFKMLIARAITSAPMPRDTTASIIISSLAHRLIAEMSVGLNAVAVQNASER